MTAPSSPSRRSWIAGALATVSALWLAGCDRLAQAPNFQSFLQTASGLNRRSQRLLVGGALAKEYSPQDITPAFKSNGTLNPPDADYQALLKDGFKDWRLVVDGLVERPLSLNLDDLKARAARTQITRHDCVEGWSCIGQWTGPQLGPLLRESGLKPNVRYIVFHCADSLAPGPAATGKYYESIDLFDAFHPQTILAYAMNGQPLPVSHGAPLRLRVERQLGYKQAKYLMRIEAVDRLEHIGGGKGGFWEDRGYEWYAGI